MQIQVIGRHVDVTDAIKAYGEQKAAKLPKFSSAVHNITLSISKTGSHVVEYDVELLISVDKHPEFVSHAKAADPYAAIDLVVSKGERQLRDYKEKLQG
jgi:putative sigma-54 modulation protein